MENINRFELISKDEEQGVEYENCTLNFKIGDFEIVLEWRSKKKNALVFNPA
ncbi:MAG: hypothetical protein N4A40_02475 [Tissierellales bacterium]|jgi:hypothetical protein|nr:hypothetical protein [Tissierellales bacterium]